MGFVEIGLIVVIHYHIHSARFNPLFDYQALTLLPLFFMAIVQLVYNSHFQKSEFVRNYAEKFFTNEVLYVTFNELIYIYTNNDFKRVQKFIKDLPEEELAKRPVVIPTSTIGRDIGTGPLYHPEYFQGSKEERRLDTLIGYFDLLGYHLMRGHISIEDIAGTLGYFLNIMSKREVISALRTVYLRNRRVTIHSEDGSNPRVDIEDPDGDGSLPPFFYFDELIKAIDKYDKKRVAKGKEKNKRDENARKKTEEELRRP
jgi:hypothetical protein